MRRKLLIVLSVVVALGATFAAVAYATITLSGTQVVAIDSGRYHLQANEWNSKAAFTITSTGGLNFKIVTSGINNATNGAPGAYPALTRGCHWTTTWCTSSSGLPMVNSTLTLGGKVKLNEQTALVSTGAWDSSWDIWFNPQKSTTNNSSGLEMMLWLACSKGSNAIGCSVQPAGSRVSHNVVIGGRTYDVFWNGKSTGGTISYVLRPSVTSISSLDLAALAKDAIARKAMTSAWYLIDAEVGFEPWQGGVGLAVSSASICTPVGCS